MLNISFWEIAVIGAVALVVLGPERLPKVARTAGHLFGRLQRYVATVKADINREMEGSELAKLKQEVQEAARTFETSVHGETRAIEAETRAISTELEKTAADANEPVPVEVSKPDAVSPSSASPPHATQADLILTQGAEMFPLPQVGALTPSTLRFDLGIEPVRNLGH